MRLLRAELTRFFARRFTGLMLLTLVFTLGVVALVLASGTHRPTATEVQQAETAAADARVQCEQSQADAPGPSDGEWDCDGITSDSFLAVLNFREEMPQALLVLIGLLALFGYLVGASVVGAEWPSGGITNLLLWRTQRVRVLFGKLTALTLGVFLVGTVVGGAWLGGIWLIARFRGELGELTKGFWISLGLDGVRGMAFVLCVTLVGATLASLGRRTAAALGVVIGYLVVWEIGVRLIMTMLRLPPDPFMLATYTDALLTKDVEVYDCWPVQPPCDSSVIPWSSGAVVIGAITLLLVIAAAWSFRRRDVA